MGPPSSSGTEVLLRMLKAGGQTAWYAKPIETGMIGLRKIVAEFDEVPDAGTILGPGNFSMNAKGEVVFQAGLLGSDFYPRSGIIGSLPATGLERAILVGDSLPCGGQVASFGAPILNNNTQVAFFASSNISGVAGIYVASPTPPNLQKVVCTGDAWPTGGGTFTNLNNAIAFNVAGQVAFQGGRSAPSRQGIFLGSAGSSPTKIVETVDAAPIGTFGNLQTPFKLNAAGKVAFVASYPSGVGVFLGTVGGLQTVAKAGDPAPGAGGATFGNFNTNTIDLNNAGKVAFWANLNNPSPTPTSIWQGWFIGSATPSDLAPRLLQHQPLPGGGQADSVSPGNRFAVLADSGEMAIFVDQVTGGGVEPQVVIAGVDGTLRMFAGSGERAQGTGSDFGKFYPTLVATPSNKFLFGAVLVDGPAKAGVFVNK